MGNIVLLDELTINKIAAGEVIERPASVVKEMMENSIDAGANNITVEIKNGGISYIKITDNGKGIAQDDLEIAFERHATSKIRVADDLNTVTSMGFRGEALASIAAISNIEMISKTDMQETGYRIVVEGGEVLEKEEIGCQTGTSITVRNLFYNTPVRYKFLKKDYTESGYIEDVVTRIALINPNIAIKLINTGKTVIQTNGSGNLKDVIYSIYGKDVANGIMEVEYKYEDINISGVIGKPEIARSNRSNQLFFVNKRYIKDKTLTAATEQAYKGLIPIGKFGFIVLNIEINPAKVDVNVHPAKLEVRFEEENKVFQSIYHAIKDTLLKNDLVSGVSPKHGMSNFETINTYKEKNENDSNGLFGFRKQNEEKIEKYTDEESKIKTNKILENSEKEETIKIGSPIDTSDVLEKLRKLKEEMENELKQKSITPITIEEPKTEYELEENKEEIDTEKIEDKENQNIENKEPIEEINLEQPEETIEKVETPITEEFEQIKEKVEELNNNPQIISNDFNEMYTKLFGTPPVIDLHQKDSEQIEQEIEKVEDIKIENAQEENKEEIETVDLKKDNISVFEEEPKNIIYKFIGIVFNTYIILEIDNEMYILDQHAAHERIIYERVKKNYYSNQSKDSQMLLLPDIITLTHKEMELARENMGMFEQAGFTLEEFGENTIKLNGVPTICFDLDTKELFLETLDEINTVSRTSKQEKEERFIATVACKAAVKANMALDEKEVTSLMDDLLELPNPFTCPHGRPTVIKMSKYEIERKFARK